MDAAEVLLAGVPAPAEHGRKPFMETHGRPVLRQQLEVDGDVVTFHTIGFRKSDLYMLRNLLTRDPEVFLAQAEVDDTKHDPAYDQLYCRLRIKTKEVAGVMWDGPAAYAGEGARQRARRALWRATRLAIAEVDDIAAAVAEAARPPAHMALTQCAPFTASEATLTATPRSLGRS